MYGNNHSIGCLSVACRKIGDDLDVSCQRDGEELAVVASRIGNGLDVSCGIVCSTGTRKPSYFLVTEGYFILSDGKKFRLRNGGRI